METTDTNHIKENLFYFHSSNRRDFLVFFSELERPSRSTEFPKKSLKSYYSLNLKLLCFLVVLKFLDVATTQFALTAGLARESNAIVVPLLDKITLLYFISFLPMVVLYFLNVSTFRMKRLALLKFLTVSCVILMMLLVITVLNNFIVIIQALS